ncbi:MAG TPA: metalloregulator ArsR/SmtB family transcription factor [Rectinemataceae bacterium]|nr:metalloregulator ArsR/SmtB family transcription factor [Rectinemataceae bacterium]
MSSIAADKPDPALCSCSVLHEDRISRAKADTPSAPLVAELGSLFKVFADETRLKILSALAAEELCVCDLSSVLGASQSAVSHQLAVLRAARLVRHRREGKVVFYSLGDDHVGRILAIGLEHAGERFAQGAEAQR